MRCSPQRPARAHKRWPLAALAELHHARFLLQPSALELFLADRTNALLSFPSPEVCHTGNSRSVVCASTDDVLSSPALSCPPRA